MPLTAQERGDNAARAGRLAARAGKPPTDCPHPVNGTPVQRALALRWLRAYNRVAGAAKTSDGS